MNASTIGFKTAKAAKKPNQFKGSVNLPLTEIQEKQIQKFDILIKIAQDIDLKMQQQAKSVIKDRDFGELYKDHFKDRLSKIYIKYYEPL